MTSPPFTLPRDAARCRGDDCAVRATCVRHLAPPGSTRALLAQFPRSDDGRCLGYRSVQEGGA